MGEVHNKFINKLVINEFSSSSRTTFVHKNRGEHTNSILPSIDLPFNCRKKTDATLGDMPSVAGSFILAQVVKRERQPISRDLHDRAGQQIVSRCERIQEIGGAFEIRGSLNKHGTSIPAFLPLFHH
ncbi:hypothetical protein V1T76_22365 [Roseibium sp. FZY0029]|uniref:hypothetical protein n=1 Tax=Roseibium sp. FZY0029 TaxID=3116647 RepID=UPI002ECDBD62|nr:hypothetical protein [Roseibium sp. FZY0029]